MIYLLIIYLIIANICIIYMIFNLMDVASWVWVKGKTVILGIFSWLKGFIK